MARLGLTLKLALGAHPRACQAGRRERREPSETATSSFDHEVGHSAMPGWLDHLKRFQGACRSYRQEQHLPAIPWMACGEQKAEQGKGTEPLKGDRGRADGSVADGADCDDDESGEQEPAEGTSSFGHSGGLTEEPGSIKAYGRARPRACPSKAKSWL
jgi:hypothetical protein